MTVFFKGRENATREERGFELYKRIDEAFGEHECNRLLMKEADSGMGFRMVSDLLFKR